ncbi:MAG: OmpA family protein [Armatimonadetes bacterium]|nr:OmpA family protein [Armatimonadota bacterium]
MRLTPAGKAILLLLFFGGLFGLYRHLTQGPETADKGTPGGSTAPVSTPSADTTGAVLDRPLRVGIVSWPGYAGGIVANNGFKPNTDCIFWKNHKLRVEFLLLEDIDVRGKAFAKGGPDGVDVVWSTVDFWANELPGLNKSGIEAAAIMQVDWSRGGDAIVADASIQRIEDLKGKKISLVQFTPSHWFLEFNLQNSSLDESQQEAIVKSLVSSGSTMDARSAFVAKQVDASVIWEPDVTAALERPGSHVLVSSATATDLIADLMVTQRKFIEEHRAAVKAFVEGWLDGAVEANRNPSLAVKLLMENEELYKELGEEATRDGLTKVRLTDLTDNTRVFGLDGSRPRFDDLFDRAGRAWLKRGYIPYTVAAKEAKDDSFLRDVYARHPVAPPKQEFKATAQAKARAETAKPLLTKQVRIQFAPDSAALTVQSKKTLDTVAGLLQAYSNAYVRVEGNTVGSGNAFAMRLSKSRADSVVAYLVAAHGLDANRFTTRGNGPFKPIASNNAEEGRAKNRRTDIMIIPKE